MVSVDVKHPERKEVELPGRSSGGWTISRKTTSQKEETGQKHKTGNRKGESSDSPAIPDRRETSDILALGSLRGTGETNKNCTQNG